MTRGYAVPEIWHVTHVIFILGYFLPFYTIFKLHVRPLLKKTNQKLNAFARITYSLKF